MFLYNFSILCIFATLIFSVIFVITDNDLFLILALLLVVTGFVSCANIPESFIFEYKKTNISFSDLIQGLKIYIK